MSYRRIFLFSQSNGSHGQMEMGMGQNMFGHSLSDLKTLNTFFEQVSLFVKWWDWVQMETNPFCEEQPIEYQLDALRDSTTVARWKEMEVKYMCYARMVGSKKFKSWHGLTKFCLIRYPVWRLKIPNSSIVRHRLRSSRCRQNWVASITSPRFPHHYLVPSRHTQ